MMETMKQVRVMARHLVALLAVLLAGNSAKAQPAGVRLDTLQVLHIDFQDCRRPTGYLRPALRGQIPHRAHTPHLGVWRRRRALHAGQQHVVLLLPSH